VGGPELPGLILVDVASEQLIAPSGGIGSATRSDPARPISPETDQTSETDQTQQLGVELRHRSQLDWIHLV